MDIKNIKPSIKIFNCILIIISLGLTCCAQKNDSDKLKDILNNMDSSNFISSENMLYSLINKSSNDDNNVHEYYYLLDSLQNQNINRIYNQLKDKIKPKSKPVYQNRYMVGLEWGTRNFPSELNQYIDKNIKLLEEYMDKYPNGKYRYYFANELLSSYTKKDKDKIIEIANVLLEISSPDYNFNGNMFLAMVYHENKSYMEAIKYYNKIIADQKGSSQIAKYYLYKADCYYNMNQFPLAIECLNKVILLEKGLPKPFMSYYAQAWIKIIKQIQGHPTSVKNQLVTFAY